jgi:hypothetical protein
MLLAEQAVALQRELRAARENTDRRVASLSLARAVRECDALVQAVRSELTALLEQHGTESRWDAPDQSVRITEDPLGVTRVRLHGDVSAEDLVSSFPAFGRALQATDGLVLVDARSLRRHDPRCRNTLESWIVAREVDPLRRLAVLVRGGLPFVRATDALARLSGIDWSLGSNEDGAIRWLLGEPRLETTQR